MDKKENVLNKIGRSIKNLFIQLFGFGRHKNEIADELIDDSKKQKSLKEDDIISPTRQIFKKFIGNRIAILGLVIFFSIVLFIVIGNKVIVFQAEYLEPSQQYIEPGLGYTNVPKKLKKEGVKVVIDDEGKENYLIDGGSAFTIAISNANNIYIWGANIDKIKKVPQHIKEKVEDIVQLSVGTRHAVVLTSDGEFLAWGSNGFEQSQAPIYNPSTDESFYQYKKTIEAYFYPAARSKYPGEVASKIEEDPIVKVYAGDQFTTILTKSGRVYSWGVTKTSRISEGNNSFNAFNVQLRYTDNQLQWKYAIELNSKYRNYLSYDEIIDKYQLVEEAGAELQIRLFATNLQYRNYKEDDAESEKWLKVDSVTNILNELKPIANSKIVKVHLLYEHVVYELNDNRFVLVGVDGEIKDRIPAELMMTSAERGYRIEKIVGTLKNAFYIDENGKIVGWGTSDGSNHMNKIPNEIANKKIVDVDAGSYHLLVRDDSGKVYTWGYSNRLNQLNIPTNLKTSKKVIANYFNSYSIETDGTIRAWGNDGYIFGTDNVGADVLKRIIAGGSMTLSLAAVAVVVSLVIGLTVGLVAGFYGKWLDNILMRFGEIVNSFPFLPLAMTLAKIVTDWDFGDKARIYLIMIILGLLSWPGLARLVRGQILAEREKDFIMAAKALGIKERHIILRHILTNVINVVIVNTTLAYAGALLTESGLSFLGFGVRYPQPSWGNMLTGAQSMTVLKNYWWLWILPAVFIILTALSINLVGDGLRDAMDPRANER